MTMKTNTVTKIILMTTITAAAAAAADQFIKHNNMVCSVIF